MLFLERPIINLSTKRIKTELLFKLSNLNSNLALTLGYLNPALNNSAQKYKCIKSRQEKKITKGAIHSTKLSGNFGPKLNGSVRSNRKSFQKTGTPFEVDHFSRSDRLEFWLNGSRPMLVLMSTQFSLAYTCACA